MKLEFDMYNIITNLKEKQKPKDIIDLDVRVSKTVEKTSVRDKKDKIKKGKQEAPADHD